MTQKQAHNIHINILSNIQQPGIQALAKFDYDTLEPADTSSSGSGGPNAWDVAQWDVAQWAGDYTPFQTFVGAAGTGRAVAVAVRGQAVSRTIYLGCDLSIEPMGEL